VGVRTHEMPVQLRLVGLPELYAGDLQPAEAVLLHQIVQRLSKHFDHFILIGKRIEVDSRQLDVRVADIDVSQAIMHGERIDSAPLQVTAIGGVAMQFGHFGNRFLGRSNTPVTAYPGTDRRR